MAVGGVHDMGGVPGYGAVEPEPDAPVFHDEWESRVFGLVFSVKGAFSRHTLESLDPEVYLSGYYRRMMAALERGLVERGALSADEVEARAAHFRDNPEARPTRRVDPELTEVVRAGSYRQRQLRRETPGPPAFAVGDSVRTRRIEHGGHTRLPLYAQGKRGTVEAVYAAYDFPDDEDAPAQQLYSVRFEPEELWGDSAEPGASLYIDMWEGYLEPVDAAGAEENET